MKAKNLDSFTVRSANSLVRGSLFFGAVVKVTDDLEVGCTWFGMTTSGMNDSPVADVRCRRVRQRTG